MTEEDKRLFEEGQKIPLDEIIDMPIDRFNKVRKSVRHPLFGVRVMPTTDLYRNNYERINWEG